MENEKTQIELIKETWSEMSSIIIAKFTKDLTEVANKLVSQIGSDYKNLYQIYVSEGARYGETKAGFISWVIEKIEKESLNEKND